MMMLIVDLRRSSFRVSRLAPLWVPSLIAGYVKDRYVLENFLITTVR